MIRRHMIGVGLILLFTAYSMGCAPKQRKLSLNEAVREFNDALRWRRHLSASKFVMPMDRARFVKEQDNFADDSRIMEYEVREIARLDGKNMVVRVRVQYTSRASHVVIKENRRQIWTQVSGDWFVLRLEKEDPGKDSDQGGAKNRRRSSGN